MSGAAEITLGFGEVRALLMRACIGVGCDEVNARSLVAATLSAHVNGPVAMGLPHLVDYLNALEAGRINGRARPVLSEPFPATISADADGGIAQTGFDLAFDRLVEKAGTFGLAMFAQLNSYTSGELGYYVRRLAARGLVALAATNGPALMAARPGGSRVYCTNPIAFGAPGGVEGGPDGGQIVIDQASSATAFVKLVKAAEAGASIPPGWAVDADGNETTDARAAVEGALLPFGGARGANIALMVELLTAGVAGANWSLDAGDFRDGDRSPAIGLTVIALAPPQGFATRVAEQSRRLADLGVHIPGKASASPAPAEDQMITVDAASLEIIRAFASGSA